MCARYLHFVGTLPQFADAKSALVWQLNDLDGRVRRLCGGETGPRSLWFVPMVQELKRLPQIKALHEGDWSSYDAVDRLAVRRGARLRPTDIPLRLAEYAHEELALLDELETRLPLQVGVPGYLDMALFVFGPLRVFRHARTFRTAVASQISRIHAEAGERAVFQLEVPAALIAIAAAPPILRPVLAELMAMLVIRQVALAPEGSRFGVHLCLGDMGHKALRQLRTTDPLVRLANALARRWPDGRRWDYLHLPMSGGDQPPTTDPGFYTPLTRLRLPAEVRLVAGIAHEEQATEDQLAVRDQVERAVGRQVDIATSCGLGRRTPEQVARAVRSMLALL
jgi:hypothetical protein